MVTLMTVSTKHLGISPSSAEDRRNQTEDTMSDVATTYAGLNVLLAGAMMSSMLVMMICLCYLCHWRSHKTGERIETTQDWLQVPESETTVHVFTLEAQCFVRSGLSSDEEESYESGPPPDYDSVVGTEKCDPHLPSYEMAMKLSATGYV